MPDNRLITKLLLSSILAISLANIYLVSCEFYTNYKNKNGIVLQNKQTLGGDFIAFYTASLLFNNDKLSLYKYDKQKEIQSKLYENIPSDSNFLSFAYPPLFAFTISPLSNLSFSMAYFLWITISLILYTTSVLITIKVCELKRTEALFLILTSLGFTPFFLRTLGAGQTGSIGTFLLAVLFVLLIKKKEFASGLVASLFYYKPPVFLFLLLSLIITRSKKFTLGFLAGGIPIIILTIILVPGETLTDYINASLEYTYGAERGGGAVKSVPHKGAGLYALLVTFVPEPITYSRIILGSLFLVFLYLANKKSVFIRNIKDKHEEKIFYSFLMSTSIALSIHIIDYDLCMLIVPFIASLTSLYNNKRYSSLNLGVLIVLFFYLDIAIPDIKQENFILSSLSILSVIWLFYISVLALRESKFRLISTKHTS
ncbi:MAG TPA: glycosyltransferase family 87 protein [Oligoflexia bacterium]|nr:glycosyltransferase family 87 protein [Oligoflexia bacterium]HMP49356.1 glycosyltransferase family 87 protein [Oligoflexia bacterium]